MSVNLLKGNSMFDANKYKVFINKKYGKLLILNIYQKEFKNSRNRVVAFCRCECTTEKEIILEGITRNGESVVSCGCHKNKLIKQRSIKHGLTNHPLYGVLRNMKHRCYNENDEHYHRYGGRGIIICSEWLDSFPSFYEFCIKNGWKKGLTIDRIENNGNYEPLNCRFVTNKENCSNTSICKPIKGTCLKTGKVVLYERTGLSINGGFQPRNVSSCLTGRLKSSGGYRWEYA